MSGIIKTMMVTFVIIVLIVAGFSAMAARPAYTGMKCPPAVDGGQTGAVTGRVTASTNTTGIVGAYIAVVNASNASEEYFNTTSGEDGYYQILGLNASYNAVTGAVGPSGPTPYMIYADMPGLGEGYSAAFGIDASPGTSSPGTGMSPINIAPTPTPSPSPASTQSPTPGPSPSSEPTVVPTTTTTTPPTATPQSQGLVSPVLPLLLAALIAIVASGRKKN